MKKKYETPIINISGFSVENVLTSSSANAGKVENDIAAKLNSMENTTVGSVSILEFKF